MLMNMEYLTNPAWRKMFEDFDHEWANCNPGAFHDLLKAISVWVENGHISKTRAARAIAGLMFVPGVDDDPLRAEILMVAGDLETGKPCSPKHTWAYLLALVAELAATQQA